MRSVKRWKREKEKKKKEDKFRARHWNSTFRTNDVLLYKIILWQPLNSLQVTNNPNPSLLWHFAVWEQYFSRRIVCIHATHDTYFTWHTIRMCEFVKIDFEGKRKERIHVISFNIYIYIHIHTYFYRFKYILAETNDQLFCFFFFFLEERFVFFLFLLLCLKNTWNFRNNWKLKNLLHTWMFHFLLSEEKQFRAKIYRLILW